MKTPRFRKKCNKCGRTSVVPATESLCRIARLGHKPCTGSLELFSGDFDDAVLNLLAAATQVQETGSCPLLASTIDDLETWMAEAPASPAEMGWVGKDGRP